MRRQSIALMTLLATAASASACSLILGDYEVKGSGTSTGGGGTGGGGTGGGGTGGMTTTTSAGPLMVTPAMSKIGILRSVDSTANQPVDWSVMEGATGGKVDASGRYISPATPGIYHVVAKSKGTPTATQTVQITVVPLGLTIAGGIPGGAGNADGPVSYAHFNNPQGVGFMGMNGTKIIVSDTGNNTIRLYDGSTSKVTTVAGTPGVMGTKNGTGPAAQFNQPTRIALNENGQKVWVIDQGNNCLRNIDISSGAVTTLAGLCGTAGYKEGIGTAALFDGLRAVVLGVFKDALYTCEVGSNFRGIRRVDIATGTTTQVIGGLNSCDLAVSDYYQVIYYSDGLNAKAISSFKDKAGGPGASPAVTTVVQPMPETFTQSMVALTGYGGEDDIYTISDTKPVLYHFKLGSAGFDASPYSGDPLVSGNVDGNTTMARWDLPDALFGSPPYGRMYLTDRGLHVIKEIDVNQTPGTVKTVLGVPANIVAVDGPANVGAFLGPFPVVSDATGNIYVGDIASFGNGIISDTVRKIDSAGAISTLAGSTPKSFPATAKDGTGANATFGWPFDLALVGGTLYALDLFGQSIRAVDPTTNKVTTLAGQLNTAGKADGFGVAAAFDFYDKTAMTLGGGLATDGTDLFVADVGNHAIRKIVISTGEVSTLAGGTKGTKNGTGIAAQFLAPEGLAYDNGTLYIADNDDCVIRAMDVKTGVVSTFFGLSGQCGDLDGNAATANLNHPFHLAVDGLGNLYLTEYPLFTQSNTAPPGIIRRIDIAAQTISTLAGVLNHAGFVPGPLPATLNCPAEISVTPKGDLLVSDPCDGVVGLISAL